MQMLTNFTFKRTAVGTANVHYCNKVRVIRLDMKKFCSSVLHRQIENLKVARARFSLTITIKMADVHFTIMH